MISILVIYKVSRGLDFYRPLVCLGILVIQQLIYAFRSGDVWEKNNW